MTKHDLFRMAIMAAGVLPRREFVLYGQFDEELFAELREKKLARLLCREIVDTEPQWLKWDFEEAQTKIAMADIVLDTLVQETVEFLLKKEKENNSAKAQFEELEQLIKSKS